MGEHDSELHLASRRIVLAHELPFKLGKLEVEPATRQIVSGGNHQTIEPRIMQVLVALARAEMRIVTRDELVERCWDGRIVGDDAVNRVLSRIRQIAAADGGSFVVETIPRVGYRLTPAQAAAAPPKRNEAAAPVERRKLLIAGGAIALGAGLTAGSYLLRPTNNVPPEAKELFERAFALRFTGLPQDNRQAIAYLREATRIAPHYGEAWGALALAYVAAIEGEPADQVEGFENHRAEALQQADRYDPGNADAAAARVPIAPLFGHWGSFEHISRKLIRENPQHVSGYTALGTVLMDVGRWADAVEAFTQAQARNAFSPIIPYKLVVSLWSAGRVHDADAALDRALQRWPQHGAIWQTKLKILALTGRPRAALALWNDPASRPLDRVSRGMGARDLVLRAQISNSVQDVDAAIDAMVRELRTEPRGAMPTALNCSALGKRELAFDIVEGLFLGEGAWSHLNTSVDESVTHPLFQPPMRPLWNDARFTRITDRIGLRSYWRQSGSQPDYRRA